MFKQFYGAGLIPCSSSFIQLYTYDNYGKTESIKAGDNTLATYTYNSNNGKLASMTYGNGTTVSYTYDALDRIEKISYNGTVRYEYQYTAEGQLHSVSDLVNGIGYLYEYDGEDRLVGYVEYDLNDKTNTLGILYTYDEQSRLFDATTTIDYSLSSDTATQELYEQYLYDCETNMLSEYIVVFGHGVYDGYIISANFAYDDVQRTDTKTYTLTTSSVLTNTIEYTYADWNSGKLLSSFVNTYSTQMGTNTATTYTYTYDQNGNITKIVDNAGKITLYSYDDLGQLIREDNPYKNASYTYTYDNNGNRTSKKTYTYTTGTLGTATATQSYTYDDATWGDKLTAFNGTSITYDSIGNPLSYNNGTAYTFTWSDGRRLATATKGGVSYSFTYNDEGIRTSKTVGGVKHSYVLEGTRIVSEQWSNKLIIYLYDELGSPMGMLYRTNSYAEDTYDIFYFEKNLQGDIIAIYNAAGTKLVSYTYDAWGNCTTTYYNGGGSTAAQYNPFRYRGYYYDADLGFYYLNSRYYDPNTGRFINADGYVSTRQGLLSGNAYIYCENNPVNRTDYKGQNWERLWELSENHDGTHSLYDNMRHEPVKALQRKKGYIFHEQFLVVDVDNANSIATGSYGSVSGLSVDIGAEASVLTGGWEGENWDLSLLDFGVASLSASAGVDQIGYSANLCIWRPSFTIENNSFDFSISLNFGISSEYYISTSGGKASLGLLSFGIKFK